MITRFLLSLGLVFSFLALSSCAETELASHIYKNAGRAPQNEGTFKVGKPYKAVGKWYTPQETYDYSETGIASWYGAEFQGRPTANGETFDKNELTAAHRTLQMPSLVKVTNLDNGRSLVVRINDRGPFVRGRVIDLSQRAASLLGYIGRGTARVRLDLLADESKAIAMAARRGQSTVGMEVAMNERPAPLTSPAYQQVAAASPAPQPHIPGHVKNGAFFPDPVVEQEAIRPTSLYIQVGAFSQEANAQDLASRLRTFGNAQIHPALISGRQLYRVRLGPIAAVAQADALLERLAQAGHKQAITVVN